MARIGSACEQAGREPIPFSLMTGLLVGRDRAWLRERAFALHGDDAEGWLASPPETWITGTVSQVVERLGALRDAGLRRVMLQHLLHTDLETVELIGRELGPAVA